MFYKPLSDLDLADLNALVENKVREGIRIDFKLDIPEGNDEGKKEFLKDVSAFANANGGHIVYGIREERVDGKSTGVAEAVVGVANLNANETQLWMESLIRTSIEPRLVGVEFNDVEVGATSKVLIARIPRSWNAPHVVSFGKHWRFYSRNSAGNYQMDVTQLRDSFSLSDDIVEKLNNKRHELLEAIRYKYQRAKQKPISTLVIHVQPFDSVRRGHRIDINELVGRSEFLRLGGDRTGEFAYNFDGVQVRNGHEYLQIFHSGMAEEVLTDMFGDGAKGPYLASWLLGRTVAKAVGSRLCTLKEVGIDGPVMVGLSLLGIDGRTLLSQRTNGAHKYEYPVANRPDRSDFVTEAILLENIAALPLEGTNIVENHEIPNSWDLAASLMRPALDSIWNGYGIGQCLEYNSENRFLAHIPPENICHLKSSGWIPAE